MTDCGRILLRRLCALGLTLGATVIVTGCGGGLGLPSMGDLNPFKEEEQKLPGKRIPVLAREDGLSGEIAAATEPVALPPQTTNPDWSQPGGAPNNAPGHLALQAAVKTAWTADIGTGSNSDGKLTVSPIVVGGRIYTMDTEAKVSAFSASGGGRIWTVSLVPPHENGDEGYGGGIAASRLARAGQSVCLLERGREIRPGEYPEHLHEAASEMQLNTPAGHVGYQTIITGRARPLGILSLLIARFNRSFEGAAVAFSMSSTRPSRTRRFAD